MEALVRVVSSSTRFFLDTQHDRSATFQFLHCNFRKLRTYRYCSKKASSSSSSSSASSSRSFPSSLFSWASLRASSSASSIIGVGEGGFSGMMPCFRRISFLQGGSVSMPGDGSDIQNGYVPFGIRVWVVDRNVDRDIGHLHVGRRGGMG
jgi:hypothetical protein